MISSKVYVTHAQKRWSVSPRPSRSWCRRYNLYRKVSVRAYGISCARGVYIECIWNLACPSPKFDHDKMCKMLSKKHEEDETKGRNKRNKVNYQKRYWSRIKLRLIHHHTSAMCLIDYSIEQNEIVVKIIFGFGIFLGNNFGNKFRVFRTVKGRREEGE